MKKVLWLLLFLGWTCSAHAQGKIENGLWKIYQGNVIGNLVSCKKLQLDGVAFQYYDNGNVKRQSWYEKNKLQGPTKYFSKDNQLIKTHVYQDDKLAEVILKP
jgi:antitoxin component YwqK of YwqJK toxin-antitoxin module